MTLSYVDLTSLIGGFRYEYLATVARLARAGWRAAVPGVVWSLCVSRQVTPGNEA
jgi:hypothetical protein